MVVGMVLGVGFGDYPPYFFKSDGQVVVIGLRGGGGALFLFKNSLICFMIKISSTQKLNGGWMKFLYFNTN